MTDHTKAAARARHPTALTAAALLAITITATACDSDDCTQLKTGEQVCTIPNEQGGGGGGGGGW